MMENYLDLKLVFTQRSNKILTTEFCSLNVSIISGDLNPQNKALTAEEHSGKFGTSGQDAWYCYVE